MKATIRELIRNRFQYRIEHTFKELSDSLIAKEDAVDRVCDWLQSEFARISPNSYKKNRDTYNSVIREQVKAIGDKVYGADSFDALVGVFAI